MASITLLTKDLQELASLAEQIAVAAGRMVRSRLYESYKLEYKEEMKSPAAQVLTPVDRDSEQLIVEGLQMSMKKYAIGILSEERVDDGSRFQQDYFWCIDPIDGTLAFTEQRAGFAVSIALITRSGEVLMGVVYDPMSETSYQAIRGVGVHKNGEFLQRTQRQAVQSALRVVVDQSFWTRSDRAQTEGLLEVCAEKMGYPSINIYSYGGAVLNACQLIEQEADLFLRMPSSTQKGGCLWDYAATSLLCRELGMSVSDALGKMLHFNTSSVYMHDRGLLYAIDEELSQKLVSLYCV